MSTLVELLRQRLSEIPKEEADRLWDLREEDDKIGPPIGEFLEFTKKYNFEKKIQNSNIECTNPLINQNKVSGFFIHKKIVKNYDPCSVLAC